MMYSHHWFLTEMLSDVITTPRVFANRLAFDIGLNVKRRFIQRGREITEVEAVEFVTPGHVKLLPFVTWESIKLTYIETRWQNKSDVTCGPENCLE